MNQTVEDENLEEEDFDERFESEDDEILPEAEEDPAPRNKKRDAFIVIVVVLAVWLVIILSGNGNDKEKEPKDDGRPDAVATSTTATSTPTATSSTRTPNRDFAEVLKNTTETSFYEDWVRLERGSASQEFYPAKEYVSFTVNQRNLSYLFISNWSLVNSAGERFYLGNGTYLPRTSTVNPQDPIVLQARDKVTISSGRSPIGVSFKENRCTGYFEQFQDFVPELRQECPSAGSETIARELDRECKAFINRIPRCEINVDPFPIEASLACRSYVNLFVNYNSCVNLHEDDKNFERNTWRIFLGEEAEIWKAKGEIITLLDAEGKVVDQVRY